MYEPIAHTLQCQYPIVIFLMIGERLIVLDRHNKRSNLYKTCEM